MAGFLTSQSWVRVLSKWNFAVFSWANGISWVFGGLLVRIAKYLLNGSPRKLKFHRPSPPPRHVRCLLSLKVWVPLHLYNHSFYHLHFSDWFCMAWQPSTFYSFFFKDMLKCLLLRERKLVAWTIHNRERETIMVKPQYIGHAPQDIGEQIPASISWQTINNSTVGPKLTIDVGNWVVKKNQKHLHYFSDVESSLGGTQYPKFWVAPMYYTDVVVMVNLCTFCCSNYDKNVLAEISHHSFSLTATATCSQYIMIC